MAKRHITAGWGIGLLCWLFCRPVFPVTAQTANSAVQQTSARAELDMGTRLTRSGMLLQAIPHLLTAQTAGLAPYATGVNLGICYVGTNQYALAISTLEALRKSGSETPTVDNLLAQAYLGNHQSRAAFEAFQRAAAVTPKSEKLYAFMADACSDDDDYELGLRVANSGLQQLPDSARLHYERALFLARLDRFDEAKPDFEAAARLAPSSYIGVLALVQENLYEDNLTVARDLLRKAVREGHRDYQTLSLLGSVLLFEGAIPGQPEFAEARSALEQSATAHPNYSSTQIALGKLYMREGRFSEAVAHLEIGQRLEPNDPAVYAALSTAYHRLGEKEKAAEASAQMARLLAQKKASTEPPHR